jgi:peptidoglycan/xylan/chitin deacetylase (PgdA/CDA1 family)
MSLPDEYLRYDRRQRGMDHALYPWRKLPDHPAFAWPGGKSVATMIVVSLEWFPIVVGDAPFKAPGHMQTAYPDYRHYTSRDYGTRVGFDRFLDAFEAVGAQVGIAANAAVAERYPAVIANILERGHEIVAHSTDMDGTIATGLPEEAERDLIARSLDGLEKATGSRPRGWLSIARSQSWNTPRLLAEAGLDYMLDWVNDELPFAFDSGAGTIVNVPLNHELSDRQVITVQQNSAESYCEQLSDAWQWLAGEAAATGAGRMLPIHLTPYVMGLPYRIGALEALLAGLAAEPANVFATPGQVLDGWRAGTAHA